jgi:hypothetical protein
VSPDRNPTSLKLKVEIDTTDTAERSSVTVLVDSGATGEFINRHYSKSSCFNLVKLTQPIPVYNIDGTLNEAGSIMEVVTLIPHYNNHLERTTFAVSGLGRQKLIVGQDSGFASTIWRSIGSTGKSGCLDALHGVVLDVEIKSVENVLFRKPRFRE